MENSGLNNFEKWSKFLNRKRYKFKEMESKWGKFLLVKTYNKANRCNILIKDDKIRFHFYSAYKAEDGMKFKTQHQISFSKRNGTLHVFSYDKKKNKVINLGLNSSNVFKNALYKLKDDGYYKSPSKRINYKVLSILEFFLKLQGFRFKNLTPETLLELSYPALKNVPLDSGISRLISRHLRKNIGLYEICKKMFGHKSKILMKLFVDKGEEIAKFELGYLLKPMLNRGQMEKVVSFDDHRSFFYRYSINTSIYRRFFRQFTSEQLVHLFTQKYSDWHVQDACSQWAEFPKKIIIPKTVKNWENVHDEITNQYRKLEQEDYEFNLTPKLKLIHGTKVENEEIIVPKTRHELIDWGTKMNNCIAGYHSSFNRGETVLLGVKKGNDLLYNIEIRDNRIAQFMENRNHRANQEVIEKYSKIFKEFKLISKGDF